MPQRAAALAPLNAPANVTYGEPAPIMVGDSGGEDGPVSVNV